MANFVRIWVLFFIFFSLWFAIDAQAYQLENQQGDIAVWMFPVTSPGDKLYPFQSQMASHEAKISELELLQPFWGNPIRFWDNTGKPLTIRAFCGHIEPLEAQANVSDDLCKSPFILVLIRLNNFLDKDVLVNTYHRFFNNEMQFRVPFFEVDQLFYDQVMLNEFAPMKSNIQSYDQYNTIGLPHFWDRYYNCATATTWGILIAWYTQADETGKQKIIDLLDGSNTFSGGEIVQSIDLVTPGFLCWWLTKYKLAKVVNVIDFSGTLTDLQIALIMAGWNN